jgi:hypothetical protein
MPKMVHSRNSAPSLTKKKARYAHTVLASSESLTGAAVALANAMHPASLAATAQTAAVTAAVMKTFLNFSESCVEVASPQPQILLPVMMYPRG